MTPSKRVRISREEAIEALTILHRGHWMFAWTQAALAKAIRALKREQRAARDKKRSKR